MAEVLRDLVVSLSLNTNNFSRNINSINRQIRVRIYAADCRYRSLGTEKRGAEG